MDKDSRHRRRSLMIKRKEPRILTVWSVVCKCTAFFICYVSSLRYLNPVNLVREKQRRIYYTDCSGNTPIFPSWKERMINLFITENQRRKNILRWVKQKVPKQSVVNFTSTWHDGIVLCSLLEALQPGVCPGNVHLKHHNRVNNCRLGIRLAAQSLGLPQDMIQPEEMAIADKSTEAKILKYISMIKWAAENKNITRDSRTDVARPKRMTSCVARGSGLETGLTGKKMRFTIVVSDVIGMFHLSIDIKGPKNEVYNETIISLRQSSDLPTDTSSFIPQKDRNPNPSIDERVMEFIEDGYGNSYVRWKNIKHFDEAAVYDAIAFQCLCNGENTFLIGYTPVSAGIHTVSIRWQNNHIPGSPFKVKVYQPLDATRRSVKEPADKRLMFGSFSLTSIEEKAVTPTELADEELLDTANKSGVNDTHKHTRSNRLSAKFRKEFTITKRRVKRKVVSRNGEEIVIYESPSPTLSRQSSMTDSSTEDDCFRRSRTNSPATTENGRKHMKEGVVSHGSQSAGECLRKTTSTDADSTNDFLNSSGTRHLTETTKDNGFHEQSGDYPMKGNSQLHNVVTKALKLNPVKGENISRDSQTESERSNFKVISPPKQGINSKQSGRSEVESISLRRSVSDSSLQSFADIATLARKMQEFENSVKTRSIKADIVHGRSREATSGDYKSRRDSPTLKVIQSQSLRKSCFYINDRAFTHTLSSVSSTSSATSSSSVEQVQKMPLRETQSLPKLDNFYSDEPSFITDFRVPPEKDAISSILQGQTPENDPDIHTRSDSNPVLCHDSTKGLPKQALQKTCMNDSQGEDSSNFASALHASINSKNKSPGDFKFRPSNKETATEQDGGSAWKQRSTSKQSSVGSEKDWRKHGEDSKEYLPKSSSGNRTYRRRESMLKWIESQSLMTELEQQDFHDAEEKDTLGSVKSGGTDTDEKNQTTSSTADSPKTIVQSIIKATPFTKRRMSVGKLNKVHFNEDKFSSKTIEESFSSLDGSESSLRKGGLHRQVSVRGSDWGTSSSSEEQKFVSISDDSNKNRSAQPSSPVVTPTPKVDKITQVSAPEIMQETKYLSGLLGLKIVRRRNCIKVPIHQSSSVSVTGTEPDQNPQDMRPPQLFRPRSLSVGTTDVHLFEFRRRFIHGIENETFEEENEDVTGSPRGYRPPPLRQSTVDTLDSGIADERGFFGHSSLLTFEDTSNRHQKIFRRPYRGNINLDPKLVMSNSIPDSSSDMSMAYDRSSSIEQNTTFRKRRKKMLKKRSTKMECSSLSDSEITYKTRTRFAFSKYVRSFLKKEKSSSKKNLMEEEQTDGVLTGINTKASIFLPVNSVRNISSSSCTTSSSRDESFTPYGLSSPNRHTLLDHLAEFRNLSLSPSQMIHRDRSLSDRSTDFSQGENSENVSSSESNNQTYSSEICKHIQPVLYPSPYSKIADEKSCQEVRPGHYVSSFDKYFTPISVNVMYLTTKTNIPVNSSSSSSNVSEKNLSISSYPSPVSDSSKTTTAANSNPSPFSDTEESSRKDDLLFPVFDPEVDKVIFSECLGGGGMDVDEDKTDCRAEGLGLTQGQVGVKNNFQVWAETSKSGALSVTIHGPRQHAVLETSIVYTGDNLYEVVFEVSHPGYYVICLKWAGKDIQNSPYLCKVTY